MTFQYASDLHLEMFTNLMGILECNLIPSAPILILAGDIEKIKTDRNYDSLQYYADNWEQVYIIPGNHEFYGSSIMDQAFDFSLELFPNVRYLNNRMLILDGIEFYFSTLWSQCESYLVENYITDFKICSWGDEKYTHKHHNQLHLQAVKWLDEALSKPKNSPRVVISHFVPSFKVDDYPTSSNLIFGPIIKPRLRISD